MAMRARAFSIFDLLVSIVVISILLAIMLPVLAHATEASRRVACRSNVRQMAIAVAMYAESNEGLIPESEFAAGSTPDTFRPEAMNVLNAGKGAGDWEGLGWLFADDYIRAPSMFYCPSHRGAHDFANYEAAWLSSNVAIVGNYHMRALMGPQYLNDLPPRMAIIADGMRTQQDYNHKVGSNVARVDLSVEWVDDSEGLIAQTLPLIESDSDIDSEAIARAWFILEDGDDRQFPGLPWRPIPVDNGGGNAGFELPRAP
jgi:type II secretory pathway pseudopilin PulG